MKIAFVIDNFDLGSPAQQLVDRFLIGYPRDGIFRSAPQNSIQLASEFGGDLIEKRVKDFALPIKKGLVGADAILIVFPDVVVETINAVKPGTPIFVYGNVPLKALDLAKERSIPLIAGTVVATALQIPAIKPAAAREALMIVQGERPIAELAALNGLMPLLENPKRVKSARLLEGNAVWAAAEKREWSWSLLRAALSRTDSPQGNAIIDGRVEDMAQLGHVQTLAKNPRAWLLEHEDHLRTTILVLDGVVGDTLAALNVGGKIHSTQLFTAPSPMREDFSRLAAVIENFFETGKAPWGRERMEVVTSGMELITRSGH
jgi:hypothetical protein